MTCLIRNDTNLFSFMAMEYSRVVRNRGYFFYHLHKYDAQSTKSVLKRFADSVDPDQPARELRCPLTESMDPVVFVDEERMSRSDCRNTHARLGFRCSYMA